MACLAVGLVVEAGDHHPADFEPAFAEIVNQLEGVGIVGDADLAAIDVPGVSGEDDLGVGGELLEQTNFDVRVETGQHA